MRARRGNAAFGILGIGSIALIAALAARSDAPASSSGDEVAAMNATQEACVAFRTGDLAAAESLLAPEFTLVSSDASVQSRAEALAEIRAGEPRYERFENVDMTARVYGDLAMVRGITRLKGTSKGSPFELDVRFTDLLLRSRTGWKIVTSHVTRIPAD